MIRVGLLGFSAFLMAACDASEGAAVEGEPSTVVATTLSGNPNVVGDLIRLEGFEMPGMPPRPVDVWLPPEYHKDPDRRFPVIYMHDGQNVFDPQHSRYSGEEWGVDEAIRDLTAAGKIEPAIVVGIWSVPETRLVELMPEKAVTAANLARLGDRAVSLGRGALRGDAYLGFLADTLKPDIDARFRTRPGQASTFVMGSSMGGLMSCYAAVERPNVFGAAACVSTHWPIGDGIIADYVISRLPAPGVSRFYFDFGTEGLDADYKPYQQRVDAAMAARGYTFGDDWLTYEDVGATHSETAWRARVDRPLTFLLGSH